MHLDFNIPLPHILLPLALSFVTFQQIAFLVDCYKHTKSLESQIPLESYRESQSKKSQTLDSPNIRESQHSQTTLDSKESLDLQSLNSLNSQTRLESKETLDSHTLDSKAATLNPQSLNSQNPQTLNSKATLDSKTNLDVQSLDSQSSLESSSIESKGSTIHNPKNTQIQERDSTHSLTYINFLDYCLFITFFPQLIAGPIVHQEA